MGITVSKKKKKFRLGDSAGGTKAEEQKNQGRSDPLTQEIDNVEELQEEEQQQQSQDKRENDDEEKENKEEEDGQKDHEDKNAEEDEEEEEEELEEGDSAEENDIQAGNITATNTYSENMQKALMGDLDGEFPENVKVVRIFTSSTFTDTSVERNTLMERVYPRLKSYCQERGYDFQVVDMKWGVRDESTDDHMTTELCMRELRACQRLSTGPNFITFLGQKYGYRPFPAQIAASEFDKLLGVVDNKDDLQLLKHWFWRDDNAVPAKYLLQPITSLLPHYRDHDNNDLRKKASNKWWAAFERIQVVLRRAADKALKKTSDRQKYHMSVTEDEIRRGIIITSNPSKHCFWFKRVISDLRQNIDSSAAGKFMDKTMGTDSTVDDNAQELLNVLREKDIPQVLPDTNIISYSVKWSDNGVDTSESEEHAQYIDKLCNDFYETLTRMIDSGIHDNESSDARDLFAEEIFQHALFCQKKCKSFHGRNEFLEASKQSLLTNEKHAIVLFGESGCGKTSIMAKVATEVKQWLKDKSAIVVLRFIGTSPDSSGIRSLLRSVCTQLCKATGQDTANIPEDMKSLKAFFQECLEKSAEHQRVVLVLDSLDQMSIDEGGRQMDWFPRQLPDNVYVILSTLPGQEYQALPSLRTILPDECFLEVPKIPLSEAGTILDSWLKAGNRDLLPKQKDVVMDAFQKCPLPLYLKMAFDEASGWKSYTPDSDTHLEVSVRDIMDDLFDQIERRHGKTLVSNALAYITASKNGLTEPELEDLLSLDEEVLNDVYQYWTPPIRRLPPLLWIRIRSDIGDYFTERGADGTQVIFWYHRQFIEAAKERYLTDVQMTKIHKNMSEYFLGRWSDGVKKPYVNKDGQEMSMDRLVAKQPLMFDTNEDRQIFNLRKLSELPFHLVRSDQLDKVKEECLCNFEFLSAKLRGTSLQMLMSDFTLYLEERPEDDDIKLLHECLQLSAHSLSKDRKQLPTQIIGRIFNFIQREDEYPDICKVLKQAYNSSMTCYIPNRKCLTAPGGVLRTAIGLSDHPGAEVISMAKDNRTIAVTSPSSEGVVIKIIDYSSGRVIRKFTMQEPRDMYRTNLNQISQKDPDLLLLAGSRKIFILNTLTGQIIQEFQVTDDEWFSYSSGGANGLVSFADDENMLVAICPDSLKIWQVKDGALLHRMPLQDVSTEDAMGVLNARGSHAVYNLRGKKTVHFVNVKIGKEVDKITVSYPKNEQGEDVFIQEVNITALDQVVVVPSSLNNLKLYDISGNLIREFSSFKMQQGLHRLQITDDGRKVVTADMYEICILDLNTGKVERCLRSPTFRLRIYTRDGINVLAIGHDGILRVYDKRREEIDENQKDTVINEIQGNTLADQITAVSSSFDHRHVLTTATVQLRNELHVWDALTGKKVCSLTKVMGHPNPVRMCTDTRGVGFIYDQKLPHYKVFNFAEGKIEKNLEGKACKRMNAFGFIDQTRMVSFSRGRRFVKVWNIDSGKVIQIVEFNEKRRFEEMLISNNGRMAVCSQASQITKHKDKELPLIAVDTTSFTHKILNYEGEQLSLVNARISDDGKYLVNLVQYSQPLLWDLSAGKLMYKLFDPAAYETATCVGVSGASMTAMTGGSDVGIKVWSIESGQVLRTITCPPVSELYVSPDGNVVISRSKDANTFDAWDTKTGKNLASFTTDGNPNHIKAIGDRLALAVGETPNLMIVHLHHPGKAGKLSEVDLKSPYDGLPATYSVADFQEKPSAVDSMDKDKDNDNGDIA